MSNFKLDIDEMLQIFEGNYTNCDIKSSTSSLINNCDYIHRLILSLKFYQTSINKNSKHSLNLFLSEIYPAHSFIDDIKHYKINFCKI